MFQWLAFLSDVVTDSSKHFALAALMGLLGFWWTWIILYASLSGVEILTRRRASTVVVYGIAICCLLAGLACVLASHWLLDYWGGLLSAPLGPPLELDLGGL